MGGRIAGVVVIRAVNEPRFSWRDVGAKDPHLKAAPAAVWMVDVCCGEFNAFAKVAVRT